MRRRSLALFLAGVLLLQGCWSAREINQLAIVLSLGVDLTAEEQVEVTAIIGNPVNPSTQGGQGASGPWILSAVGPTVFEAIRNLSKVTPRQLYWPHAETIIVSERMAQHGIDGVIDFFTRDHEPRRSIHILVAEEGLDTVLRVQPIFERSLSRALDGLILNRDTNSRSAGVDMNRYLREQTTGQTAPLLLVLSTEPEKGMGQSPTERLRLSRSAVFWHNRLVGYLNEEESRGALLLRDELKGGVLTVPCPGNEERLVTIEVQESQTKLGSAYMGKKLRGSVEVEFAGRVGQVDCPLELTPTIMEKLKVMTEERLRQYIQKALDRAQTEMGVDPFGFGVRLLQSNPSGWLRVRQDWSEAFRSMDVDISVRAELLGNGLTFNPMETPR